MIDSIILGKRLRQIRIFLGITQKQLVLATHVTQSAISRLENGEEVYASVLTAVLHYYHGKVCLDNLFATDFSADEERLRYVSADEKRRILVHQLDIIADAINTTCETSLGQIEILKKKYL